MGWIGCARQRDTPPGPGRRPRDVQRQHVVQRGTLQYCVRLGQHHCERVPGPDLVARGRHPCGALPVMRRGGSTTTRWPSPDQSAEPFRSNRSSGPWSPASADRHTSPFRHAMPREPPAVHLQRRRVRNVGEVPWARLLRLRRHTRVHLENPNDHPRGIDEGDVEGDARAPHPEPVVRGSRAVELEEHARVPVERGPSRESDLVLR